MNNTQTSKGGQSSAVGRPQEKAKVRVPRYKFDDTWKAVLQRFWEVYGVDYEEEIRDYIETGKDYGDYFSDSTFEFVWMLLTAEIDRRKLRNERARERRRMRREAVERARREAEEAAIAAARRKEEERQARVEAERRRRAEARRNRKVQKRDSITSSPGATVVPVERKEVFAHRFRGPGLRNSGSGTPPRPV